MSEMRCQPLTGRPRREGRGQPGGVDAQSMTQARGHRPKCKPILNSCWTACFAQPWDSELAILNRLPVRWSDWAGVGGTAPKHDSQQEAAVPGDASHTGVTRDPVPESKEVLTLKGMRNT